MAGTVDCIVSIFGIAKEAPIRKFDCHNKLVSDVSWCHAPGFEYLVATASIDGTVVLHDVRQKFSVV